jgi:CRP-like cAMP-binding protein
MRPHMSQNRSRVILGAICSIAGIIGSISTVVRAEPMLVDPTQFEIELFMDLAPFGPEREVLQLTISPGENGFPPGLYLTTPFSLGSHSVMRISPDGDVETVLDGLQAPETILFAQGEYGDGMLIAEAGQLRIQRLTADGIVSTFAGEAGTPSFGVKAMSYGADGLLYATDFSGGRVLRVNPDGSSETFALVPGPETGTAPPGSFIVAGNKALTPTAGIAYGEGFLTGTFSVANGPNQEFLNADKIYFVSADGQQVQELASGFNGLELYTFGPGGPFGEEVFIAEMGSNVVGDGAVSILSPTGNVTPFITGIDATHVVFDVDNVMGGGMFVAEFGNYDPDFGGRRSGRIWRVTPLSTILPGDHNGDGAVNAADYVFWRKNDGTQEGYNAWRANFGAQLGSDAATETVPEPTNGILLLLALTACCLQRRTIFCLLLRPRERF